MPRKATKPIPRGLTSLTTQLWFNGTCREAVDFYKKAFGAKQIGQVETMPDGKVMHAQLKFGDTSVFLADAMGSQHSQGPDTYVTAGMYLYVKDCDRAFEQATKNGCTVIMPMQDMFWGDRSGEVKDPYGHIWDIATHKQDLSPAEMKKAGQEWIEKFAEVPA